MARVCHLAIKAYLAITCDSTVTDGNIAANGASSPDQPGSAQVGWL